MMIKDSSGVVSSKIWKFASGEEKVGANLQLWVSFLIVWSHAGKILPPESSLDCRKLNESSEETKVLKELVGLGQLVISGLVEEFLQSNQQGSTATVLDYLLPLGLAVILSVLPLGFVLEHEYSGVGPVY
ncbi:Centrosomal protein [Gossypium arboreum]|uniref:Centrosomal protein n=1 Tax=Gossypium arboreum TaxID=29729 RepID=A0A0B0MVQ4_GOSAR|nr:Centrosomal protein [Gossypium arboreum]